MCSMWSVVCATIDARSDHTARTMDMVRKSLAMWLPLPLACKITLYQEMIVQIIISHFSFTATWPIFCSNWVAGSTVDRTVCSPRWYTPRPMWSISWSWPLASTSQPNNRTRIIPMVIWTCVMSLHLFPALVFSVLVAVCPSTTVSMVLCIHINRRTFCGPILYCWVVWYLKVQRFWLPSKSWNAPRDRRTWVLKVMVRLYPR